MSLTLTPAQAAALVAGLRRDVAVAAGGDLLDGEAALAGLDRKSALGGGGPRLVGSVMAAHGGPVPWWRVVRADGSLPSSHQGEARLRYVEEGTPLRASGNVDIKRALFRPEL